ncbi:GyrI-like domain-containing protein [Paenibacillus hamazuiensis]|uniref:GyrI-like domain-containing protein n=1 Tax=Paenibacillus hamazuiensis TaxID=2936508 RepID=UPI00200EEE38|nr:GyrI-like domain-containing protein [Paenibacillus hamazuiensis]
MNAFLESKKPGVVHYVNDLKQAAQWYRDILGFEIGPHEYGSFVELFMQGQYMFHLARAQEGTIPHAQPVITLTSRDIEATYSVLKSAGVEVGRMSWYPDYSSFTLRDVDGNAIAVTQSFEMRIRDLEEMQLLGIRVICSDGEQYAAAIPKAAFQLRQRLGEISGIVNERQMVGVYKPGETVAEEDGYWVGVRVERIDNIPEGMTALHIPAQTYAVKWHYGLRSGVSGTYSKLHGLMREAGLRPDPQAWHIEMQRNWGRREEGEIELDLYCAIIQS